MFGSALGDRGSTFLSEMEEPPEYGKSEVGEIWEDKVWSVEVRVRQN